MNTKMNSEMGKEVHHGRNVKRFREMFGIKQDVLADTIGLSQQSVSRLESQEMLDEDDLIKFAKALHIPVEAIKNFNDEIAVNIISNTFNAQSIAYQNNVHPLNKIIDLYESKIALYERFLRAEQDKNALLEKLWAEKP